MIWKLGVVAELTEEGTALLSAVVSSQQRGVCSLQKRQRGLRERYEA